MMTTSLARRIFGAVLAVGVGVAASARAAPLPDGDDDEAGAPTLRAHAPPAGVPGAVPDVTEDSSQANVPFGFYKDKQGRVMQISFDLQKRAWLGVAYAPRRRPTGTTEVAPAAFDFGIVYDDSTESGRTRTRLRFLDGQVQLHPFALDVTGLRYDVSHRYEHPLVRITTFVGLPARHDLYMNVGYFVEALHFDSAPRGVAGEQELTLGTLQATLDLWQSADLRSYVRLRAGPGVELRYGPWGETAELVGFAPQTTLEGNIIMGDKAMQLLTFSVRGDLLRSVSVEAKPLPGDWAARASAAYEAILLAINDQPVSLRLAFDAGLTDGAAPAPGAVNALSGNCCGWEWKATAGVRMSFFTPPVLPIASR